ncbi:MAG: class I SAM-dependent methyltransferase [bacterium]
MAVNIEAFRNFEHSGWTRVAHRYDSTWAPLTGKFVDPLLAAAGVKRGMRVLDVACGPGYVAAAARRRGALPLGIDFCREMVEQAKRKNAEKIHECLTQIYRAFRKWPMRASTLACTTATPVKSVRPWANG